MTRREQQRQATLNEIKTLARRQMAREGTGALSLRAIAAEMGVTAPALYRYYANRDDLITALIIDAYNALADTTQAACDAQPPDDHIAQMRAGMLAYRRWALDNRVDFELIFGNPIPSYHAPVEQTRPVARRNITAFANVIANAARAGKLHPRGDLVDVPAPVREALGQIGDNAAVVYVAMHGWARIHGLIMLELFGHSPPVVGDPEAFYRHEIELLLRDGGFFEQA